MTLLLLISSLEQGGAETHLLALVSELTKRGHAVTVISSGGGLADELIAQGIAHQTLPLHSRSPLALLRSFFSLRHLLRTKKFDLIHAHSRIPAFLIARTAKQKNIPMITTVHAKFRTTPLLRRYSRWGDYSIAVSEDLKQYLCENYPLSAERIRVIFNGIDTKRFTPSPKNHQVMRLVALSRLDEDCSLIATLLCRLAPVLHQRFPSLQIILGGGGSALPELRRLVHRVNQAYDEPIVFLTGSVSQPSELLSSADAVVGVSRVALEAMACRVPVILAGNEGFLGVFYPELFEEASATNFCARGKQSPTEELLLSAISELFSLSAEERTLLGDKLCQLIRTQYDIEKITNQTLEVYEQLCNEYRRRGRRSLVLCGYYGDGNTGDHALLRAAIARAAVEHPELSPMAITAHGKKDEPLFGIPCIPRRNFPSLLRAIRRADCFVFGGGTLLQDRTSLRSLCYYTFLLQYAKRHGALVALWANGLSEPHSRLAKALMRRALHGVQRVGLRDLRSLSLAKELCTTPPIPTIAWEEDLAAHTPPAKASRIRFLLGHFGLLQEDGSVRRFAIVAPHGNEAPGQLHIFSLWLRRLLCRKIHPVFVPLFPKEDTLLCQRMARDFGGTLASGLSESDLVGLMQYAQTVASMRLHSLIVASSAGSDFVGFGGDPKIESFCREHGGRYWTEDLE